MKDVFIVGAKRTPMGSFGGALTSFSATKLGSLSIEGVLEASNVSKEDIDEVFFGNVCQANLGQAPARQAALGAGIPTNVPCTTVNKVCASGMKSIIFAAQTIKTGDNNVVVAGGMESMSNIPYYLDGNRWGMKYGNGTVHDGLQKDGLTDVYKQIAMGVFADNTATAKDITREDQDRFAIQSYTRTAEATDNGSFEKEIIPVSIPQRKGDPIVFAKDEEYTKVMFDKIPGLRPAFSKDGTVTAANASTINDGASALVLASGDYVTKNNLKPVARVVSYADAAHEPEWFTTAPVSASTLR